MPKEIKVNDDARSVTHGISLIENKAGVLSEEKWYMGPVLTKWGIVLVHSEPGDRPFTSLRFVWKGILYDRDIAAFYHRPYLATLARRFAEEKATK